MKDVTEFLASIELNLDMAPVDATVTYQDSCHLAHGQKIRKRSAPAACSAIPGLKFREMPLSDLCCGSAGIYNVLHTDLSMSILEKKMANVESDPCTHYRDGESRMHAATRGGRSQVGSRRRASRARGGSSGRGLPGEGKDESCCDKRAEKMISHEMTTSTFDLPGYRITRSLGIVRGIVVRSRSVFGSIGASLQTLVGGDITLFTDLCEKTREDAFERMLQHAGEMGADAVIGIRYDANEVMQGVTEVLCYGTAVKIGRE